MPSSSETFSLPSLSSLPRTRQNRRRIESTSHTPSQTRTSRGLGPRRVLLVVSSPSREHLRLTLPFCERRCPPRPSLIPRAVGFGGAILLCVALAYFISDRRWTKKKPIIKKSRGVVALQIIQEGVSVSGAPPPRTVLVQQCIRDKGVLEVLCNYDAISLLKLSQLAIPRQFAVLVVVLLTPLSRGSARFSVAVLLAVLLEDTGVIGSEIAMAEESGIWSKPNNDNFTQCIELPRNHKRLDAKTNGYILINANGDLNQMRFGVW
ncbi:uncharacterized protein DS421_12g378100 [Arachis hypogaea]|nr:uncharacterized protein DS421_12g378100 [Arachis hypogaea]